MNVHRVTLLLLLLPHICNSVADSFFGDQLSPRERAAFEDSMTDSQTSIDALNALQLMMQYIAFSEGHCGDYFDIEAGAKAGNHSDQYFLGDLYHKGFCVVQDDTAAFKWLSAAAKGEYSKSYYDLGQYHYLGIGTDINKRAAAASFEAAAKTDVRAHVQLAMLYLKGVGVVQNYAKALEYASSGAELGDPSAQLMAAVLLSEESLRFYNADAAYKWALLAKATGNEGVNIKAGEIISRLDEKLSPNRVHKAQDIASEWAPKPLEDALKPAEIVLPRLRKDFANSLTTAEALSQMENLGIERDRIIFFKAVEEDNLEVVRLFAEAGADDDLLGGDLLDGEVTDVQAMIVAEDDSPVKLDEAAAAHLALFSEDRYPSANTCGSCHPKQFDQWSVSQHAYAQISPVYMAMQNTINAMTSNTNGDFCIRCHNPIGMNKEESTYISNLERHPASREGITCVVCHRLDQEYGKVSGRVALIEGDLTQLVYGPTDGTVVKAAIEGSGGTLTMDADKSGRKIHGDVGHFPFISTSGFCAVCHDVNLFNGFRLEEAFSDYKRSPASAAGTSCQDCHMGRVQGKVSGYEHGPAASIGSKHTPDRKLTNHFFAGPDYSLVHPGIFPHNIDAVKMATLADWLKFDVEAGWGTDEFEDSVSDDYEFPKRWQAIDDRYDARAIIDSQLKRLAWAEEKRFEVLRNGYGLSETRVTRDDGKSLRFELDVMNKTDGHSVPTGFDAERVVWVEVTVTDAAGNVVYVSGDLDPNGDLRDSHSLYVHNGDLPLDKDLLSLQSKFITRNVRGGEREQVLAVNFSVSSLPFIRPSTNSTILTGQPSGVRKHRYGLPPLAKRTGSYIVKGLSSANGPYEITTRLKTGMIPINLIFAIQGVGFDYGMSPRDIADGVVKGHQVLYEHKVKVSGGTSVSVR